MQLDQKLIIDVEAKAGGSVHAVNEATCNYKACVSAANGEAWWNSGDKDTPNARAAFASLAEKWEAHLRVFLATGDFPKPKPQVLF